MVEGQTLQNCFSAQTIRKENSPCYETKPPHSSNGVLSQMNGLGLLEH
jgi:hypothetical protein